MDYDLPPDPYVALGVASDAPAASIKAIYRKLVLKCHPDKVQDDALKQKAADEFHSIQSAYEIIGDEDRRARYDAQIRLMQLRKDMLSEGGRGGVETRTAAYKMPTNGAGDFYARGPERYNTAPPTPRYETQERRPSAYGGGDYFDHQPQRSTSKKDSDYDRSSKRSSPRDAKKKSATSAKESTREKERERASRKENNKRTDRDRRQERETQRNFTYNTYEHPSDPNMDSDSDPHERMRREDAELRRAKAQLDEVARRQQQEAEAGYFPDVRTQKMFSQGASAWDYMQRSSPGTNRERPEPVRMSSSRDKVESIKRSERPGMSFRRGSGPIGPTSRDADEDSPRKPSTQDRQRRMSHEDEPREAFRKPSLNQTKSSPADIRPPPPERVRSSTVREEAKNERPIPALKRSETTPVPVVDRKTRASEALKKESKLRSTTNAYPTPETSPSPERQPAKKYNYGREYADDHEYPTPNGYKTEVRAPEERYSRSPEPMDEHETERARSAPKYASASSRPAAPNRRTTSTTYKYGGAEADAYSARPTLGRENSSRPIPVSTGSLYGEIPTARASSARVDRAKYSPPPEPVKYTREYRPEDVKMQTGYAQRRSTSERDRPAYARESSRQQVSTR